MSDVKFATVRFPNNYTDFLVVENGEPTGYFTLQLGGADPERFPVFILGQQILPGTEANYEGQTTRVIDGKAYVVNAVYQFNPSEELLAKGEVNLDTYAVYLKDIFLKKSGFQGPEDVITVMAKGKMTATMTDVEIHYMVDGLLFATAPKQDR